jgi:hypothetical protein
MKITQIDVYQIRYGFLEHKYEWSGGHSVSSFLSHVVRLSTDEGLKGFAEVCPLGPAYMDAYASGVPSGIEELGPVLIGKDPLQSKPSTILWIPQCSDRITSRRPWMWLVGTSLARRQDFLFALCWVAAVLIAIHSTMPFHKGLQKKWLRAFPAIGRKDITLSSLKLEAIRMMI